MSRSVVASSGAPARRLQHGAIVADADAHTRLLPHASPDRANEIELPDPTPLGDATWTARGSLWGPTASSGALDPAERVFLSRQAESG